MERVLDGLTLILVLFFFRKSQIAAIMIIYSVVVLVTLARILNNKRHARKDECKFNSYEVALDALNVTIWECYENKFFVSNKLRDILHTNREIKCFQDFYFFICRRMQNIYKVFFTI